MTTIVARRPFHEAIIEMIAQASSAELETLGSLLMRVVIPEGHDKIVAAWKLRCKEMNWDPGSARYLTDDILRHKKEITKKKKSYPLNRGTRIKTTKPNLDKKSEWTEEGWASKKWDVEGEIEGNHGSHGLCYLVKHSDGTFGYYDPSEFEVL